jgi:hypothetical protein
VIQLDPEAAERRRRGYRRRGVVTGLTVLCMVASLVLPHVTVEAAAFYGRSLIRVGLFFLKADPTAGGFGDHVDLSTLAAGIAITYYGLALQEIGLVLSVFSVSVLFSEDVGRWLRRLALVAGWCLALSSVLVITGWQLMERAGVPTYIGIAWLFALAAGLLMIGGALAARRRLDSTWYWSRPELL